MYTCLAKIDWNAFNYIFSPNPREAFQQLTEQLFCFEFDQPYGIYRYYNQPHIETMPIQHKGDLIGFQSKYYDPSSNLSDKVDELKEAIEGAAKRYSGISKIIFYTNKEAGMSTSVGKTTPQYLDNINSHATKFGIEIEWRGPNEIETMLLHPQNTTLRDYFFETNGGIRQVLAQIRLHTNTVFDSIESDINYLGQQLKIKRPEIDIVSFMQSRNNILIIHGDGGCGKSGLIKDTFYTKSKYPVWLFKATDFNCPSIPEFIRKFGNCTWDNLLSVFDNAPEKICIIDSAEKLFTMDNQEVFESAIQALKKRGWKLIFTIRSAYCAAFINSFLRSSEISEHRVQKLSCQELLGLEKEWSLSLPSDEKFRDFLCNLFFLDLYLSQDNIAGSQSISDFIDRIWAQIICKHSNQKDAMHLRRGKTLCKIAETNANTGSSYYYPDDTCDWDALSALVESEIICLDEAMNGYFIVHDVYEELVLKHIINEKYSQKTSLATFFTSIGNTLVIRKVFRSWLHDQFSTNTADIENFLSDALLSQQIPSVWKDEIMVALMNEEEQQFTVYLDNIFIQDNYHLLIRGLHLLNTTCKTVDDQLCTQLLTGPEMETFNIFRFTKPVGFGWDYLIHFTNSARDSIPWSPITISLAIDVVYSWTRFSSKGATTRDAGLLALFLYQKVMCVRHSIVAEETKLSRLCDSILSASFEIHKELNEIFEEVVRTNATGHRELYTKLCEHLLQEAVNSSNICYSAPELVIKLAYCFWLENNTGTSKWNYGSDIGAYFGLQAHTDNSFYPASPFHTPILSLLNAAPDKALVFITDLFDHTTNAYLHSHLNKDYNECCEIEIRLSDTCCIKQVASDRLWKTYRGTHVGSDLLESILMALERWLYQFIPIASETQANNLCKKLLSKSHSAAITAVVTSLVTAYPEKLFDTACILIQTKEILQFDNSRLSSEQSAKFLTGLNFHSNFYRDERQKSNSLPFRKKRLENIILEYQFPNSSLSQEEFNDRKSKLHAIIDATYSNETDLPPYARYALYRMDLRKMKIQPADMNDGESVLTLVSDLPENMRELQTTLTASNQYLDKYLQLELWSKMRFEQNVDKYRIYTQYEQNPVSALSDALSFCENPCPVQINNAHLIYVAAVLLMDFYHDLDSEKRRVCYDIVVEHLKKVTIEQESSSLYDGTDAAISALPIFLRQTEQSSLNSDPAILMLKLLCNYGEKRDYAVQIFREKLWAINRDLAWDLFVLFGTIKPQYDQAVLKKQNITPLDFFREKEHFILEHLLKKSEQPLEVGSLSNNSLLTLNLLMPHTLTTETCKITIESGSILWPKLFEDERKYRGKEHFRDYTQMHAYFDWLAEVLLRAEATEQQRILNELLPNICASKNFTHFLSSLITRQDKLQQQTSFWSIWNRLLTPVEMLCNKEKESKSQLYEYISNRHYCSVIDEIAITYLFAFRYWAKNIHSWHSLQKENSIFFTYVTNKIGHHPAVLYSIARVLNTVGYDTYLQQGIKWLAEIIRNNPRLQNCALPADTEYYIEEYIQRFCILKRSEIKRNSETKNELIDILSFLVNRGSTCGYMLRERFC